MLPCEFAWGQIVSQNGSESLVRMNDGLFRFTPLSGCKFLESMHELLLTSWSIFNTLEDKLIIRMVWNSYFEVSPGTSQPLLFHFVHICCSWAISGLLCCNCLFISAADVIVPVTLMCSICSPFTLRFSASVNFSWWLCLSPGDTWLSASDIVSASGWLASISWWLCVCWLVTFHLSANGFVTVL